MFTPHPHYSIPFQLRALLFTLTHQRGMFLTLTCTTLPTPSRAGHVLPGHIICMYIYTYILTWCPPGRACSSGMHGMFWTCVWSSRPPSTASTTPSLAQTWVLALPSLSVIKLHASSIATTPGLLLRNESPHTLLTVLTSCLPCACQGMCCVPRGLCGCSASFACFMPLKTLLRRLYWQDGRQLWVRT